LSTEFRLAETIPEDGHSDRDGSRNIQLDAMSFVAAKYLCVGTNRDIDRLLPWAYRKQELKAVA
jgi:hypothetical protein